MAEEEAYHAHCSLITLCCRRAPMAHRAPAAPPDPHAAETTTTAGTPTGPPSPTLATTLEAAAAVSSMAVAGTALETTLAATEEAVASVTGRANETLPCGAIISPPHSLAALRSAEGLYSPLGASAWLDQDLTAPCRLLALLLQVSWGILIAAALLLHAYLIIQTTISELLCSHSLHVSVVRTKASQSHGSRQVQALSEVCSRSAGLELQSNCHVAVLASVHFG